MIINGTEANFLFLEQVNHFTYLFQSTLLTRLLSQCEKKDLIRVFTKFKTQKICVFNMKDYDTTNKFFQEKESSLSKWT